MVGGRKVFLAKHNSTWDVLQTKHYFLQIIPHLRCLGRNKSSAKVEVQSIRTFWTKDIINFGCTGSKM